MGDKNSVLYVCPRLLLISSNSLFQTLARAIYSKAEVIVLDDIFAGLDPENLSGLSTQLLSNNGYFREAGKTVIIATQNREFSGFI